VAGRVGVGRNVGLGVTGVTLGMRAIVGKGDGLGGSALAIYSQPLNANTRNRASQITAAARDLGALGNDNTLCRDSSLPDNG
jgi:hypothetical protein